MKNVIYVIYVMSLILTTVPFSQCYGNSSKLGYCENALSSCIDYSKAEAMQIMHLEDVKKQLEDKAVQEASREADLPWWAYIGLGLAVGFSAGVLLK